MWLRRHDSLEIVSQFLQLSMRMLLNVCSEVRQRLDRGWEPVAGFGFCWILAVAMVRHVV